MRTTTLTFIKEFVLIWNTGKCAQEIWSSTTQPRLYCNKKNLSLFPRGARCYCFARLLFPCH